MPSLKQYNLFDFFDALAFPESLAVKDAIEELALNSNSQTRGAVFTRIEVVEFILDLVGYEVNKPLYKQRILEPSFGNGDFLIKIIDRLIKSWRNSNSNPLTDILELSDAICAVELHKKTFENTRKKVIKQLKMEGIAESLANELTSRWLIQGDFLLEQICGRFNYIVGNPPYVRQELIPEPLIMQYRHRFNTIYDRADLYIPFFERSLSLLSDKGELGFICSNRWMKNRYGGPLRKFISQDFHLKAYVDMVDTETFHKIVSAYPAITIISKTKPGSTRIAHRPIIDKDVLATVSGEILSNTLSKNSFVHEIDGVVNESEPWLLESSDQMTLIRRIENKYPTLEDAGCKVGIGVATGCDKAFIGNFETLDVESDRKLPLVATRDIQSGEVIWQGKGVINPFLDDGSLVDLNDYPKLNHYLEKHKRLITNRHCAQKSPSSWYRTIDRIWPDLTYKPKLLIPDIKGEAHIVFESGKLYPHHNLYYIVSEDWDIRALQAVLLSSITRLFVVNYSTKMRGGYLRFQAQYLRRIRIPLWESVSESLRLMLMQAAVSRNLDACNQATFKLYTLNNKERAALGGNGA